jgi:hypothetical protein
MGNALAQVKDEWRAFKKDEPGDRFTNHYDRMKLRPRWFRAASVFASVLLLAIGIVLCFIPGPGTPLIVFGLALLGAHWHWLAEKLDKAEPRLRAWYQRQKQRLKRRKQHSY